MSRFLWSWPIQLTITILLFVTLALIWFLAVGSEQNLKSDSAGHLDLARLEMRQARRDAARLKQALDRYDNNRDQIRYLKDQFLTRKDERVVEISKALNDLAKTYQIGIDEVRYTSANSQNKDLELYRVEFPMQGRYRDLRNFVHDIEGSDLQLMVKQIEVEESTEYQGAVRARLSLATYFERSQP